MSGITGNEAQSGVDCQADSTLSFRCMPIITLTTDFGTKDWFVGSMKGVMLGINPQATIVDITHEVPAGDIRTGAFALATSYWCFPRLSVHVVVVDPGVGSQRAAIVARTADYMFVAPDNGVLSFALGREKILEVWRVENSELFRKPVSHTFHGRDVFAPIAARLSHGLLLDSLGTKLNDYVRLDARQPKVVGGVLRGEIIYIDHFGNAISNISSIAKSAGKVRVAGRVECDLKQFYQEVSPGQPLALLGSTGFLEIAVNGGNAAQRLNLKVGDPVEVK
jgi:S-adenosylmethionine hydrolase